LHGDEPSFFFPLTAFLSQVRKDPREAPSLETSIVPYLLPPPQLVSGYGDSFSLAKRIPPHREIDDVRRPLPAILPQLVARRSPLTSSFSGMRRMRRRSVVGRARPPDLGEASPAR